MTTLGARFFALPLLVATTGCMSLIPALAPTVQPENNIGAAFPYESHFVEVNGSKMHYVDVGEGAPIVLLHGNPTSSYLWRNVIPHLQSQGRVIAVDLIGMGKSDQPDLPYRLDDHVRYFDGFVEALGLKDITLVLHDWGGGVGFDHAMHHQDNIRGIAFMEAVTMPFQWDELSAAESYLFRTLRSDDGDTLMMDENYFVERVLPAFSGRALNAEEMAHYRAPYGTRASRKPTRIWPQEVPFDDDGPADNHARIKSNYETLVASSVPLLLLTAEPGAIIKPRMVKKMRAEIPRLKIQSVGAGLHFIQESQPTAIGLAVHAWLKTLPDWTGGDVGATSDGARRTGARGLDVR